MDKGEIVQLGPPLEVYRNPANPFVARFLGNPPMNLLAAELDVADGAVRLRLGGGVFALPGWSPGPLGATRGAVLLGHPAGGYLRGA